MKETKRKNSNGITLIALVITIIVMLILVAVTINMAVNGGLFEYAGKAVTDTKTAMEDEKEIGNIPDNLSTEELITLLTTNKEEDLKRLRLYFTGSAEQNGPGILASELCGEETDFKNNDVIPDASKSITLGDMKYGYNCEIIKYHNNYYKLFGIPVDSAGNPITINEGDLWPETAQPKFIKVEPFTDDELLAMKIKNAGNLISARRDFWSVDELEPSVAYFEYNNTIYRIDNNEGTLEKIEKNENEVLVIGGENHIKFTPTSNQTWYDWATDASNNIDLSLNDLAEGLTLKELIKSVNSNVDKKIKFTPGQSSESHSSEIEVSVEAEAIHRQLSLNSIIWTKQMSEIDTTKKSQDVITPNTYVFIW